MIVIEKDTEKVDIPRGLGLVSFGEGGEGGVTPEEARQIATEVVDSALTEYSTTSQINSMFAAESARTEDAYAKRSELEGLATEDFVNSAITQSLENYNPTNNFKTINGNSIIGQGDIEIQGGSGESNYVIVDSLEDIEEPYEGLKAYIPAKEGIVPEVNAAYRYYLIKHNVVEGETLELAYFKRRNWEGEEPHDEKWVYRDFVPDWTRYQDGQEYNNFAPGIDGNEDGDFGNGFVRAAFVNGEKTHGFIILQAGNDMSEESGDDWAAFSAVTENVTSIRAFNSLYDMCGHNYIYTRGEWVENDRTIWNGNIKDGELRCTDEKFEELWFGLAVKKYKTLILSDLGQGAITYYGSVWGYNNIHIRGIRSVVIGYSDFQPQYGFINYNKTVEINNINAPWLNLQDSWVGLSEAGARGGNFYTYDYKLSETQAQDWDYSSDGQYLVAELKYGYKLKIHIATMDADWRMRAELKDIDDNTIESDNFYEWDNPKTWNFTYYAGDEEVTYHLKSGVIDEWNEELYQQLKGRTIEFTEALEPEGTLASSIENSKIYFNDYGMEHRFTQQAQFYCNDGRNPVLYNADDIKEIAKEECVDNVRGVKGIWKGTEAEYAGLTPDPNVLYIIVD